MAEQFEKGFEKSGFEIEHGWGDEEAEISPGSVEWLRITPSMEKTQIVMLSQIAEVVRYWGHWWAPISEFRRCIVPGKQSDMSCPLCRGRFARQERFVAAVWCAGRQWRWEFSDVQRRQIVAAMREAGVVELRGLGLGLWRMKEKMSIQVELAAPGDNPAPDPLPAPCDLDALMSQQWYRQALKFGKRSEWADVEGGHRPKPGGRAGNLDADRLSSPGARAAASATPDAARPSPDGRSEATPPDFAQAYFAKHGRWPRGYESG